MNINNQKWLILLNIAVLIFFVNGTSSDANPEVIVFNTKNSTISSDSLGRELCIDSLNRVWFTTQTTVNRYTSLLNVFDGRFQVALDTNNTIYQSILYGLDCDKYGNIWLSSEGGVAAKYDGKEWTKYNLYEVLNSSNSLLYNVFNVTSDTSGNILISTWAGIVRYDFKNFVLTTYRKFNRQLLPGNIQVDNNNNIWYRSCSGPNYLGLVKIENDSVFYYDSTNTSLPYSYIYNIGIDSYNNIWTMCLPGLNFAESKLIKYDGINWNLIDSNTNVIFKNMIRRIYGSRRNNNIYFSLTYGNDSIGIQSIIVKFDGNNYTILDKLNPYLFNNISKSIVEDKLGNLWIGTSYNGLIVYKEGGVILSVNDSPTYPEFSISPNPAIDFIEITVPDYNHSLKGVVESVWIFNVYGQEVTTPALRATPPYEEGENSSSNFSTTPPFGHPFMLEGEVLKIDISFLPPGVYFVRCGDQVGKFVKI